MSLQVEIVEAPRDTRREPAWTESRAETRPFHTPSLMSVSGPDALVWALTGDARPPATFDLRMRGGVYEPVVVTRGPERSDTDRDADRTAQHDGLITLDVADRMPAGNEAGWRAGYELATETALMAGVRAISVDVEEDGVRIWTFIERRDKALMRRIYESELDLMDRYPDLTFDFNVVPLDSLGETGFLSIAGRGQLIHYRS